ncbi:MAG: hypothetical protein JWP62_771 [Blastococcus sp.]|nr:hypothetical protein [Blastococcus sp.]
MRDLRWVIAGLVVGTTLLSGCSQKVEANNTLPSTSTSPTTASLPPVGPADFPVPDEARTKDAAGAEAFLRYFIDLINRQRAVPAGQPLRDLGPQCQECLRIARNYDDAAAAGNRYVGGELTLNDVPAPVMSGAKVLISFGVRREAVSLLDSSGTAIEARPDPAPNLGCGIDLVWSPTDESWLVTGLSIG